MDEVFNESQVNIEEFIEYKSYYNEDELYYNHPFRKNVFSKQDLINNFILGSFLFVKDFDLKEMELLASKYIAEKQKSIKYSTIIPVLVTVNTTRKVVINELRHKRLVLKETKKPYYDDALNKISKSSEWITGKENTLHLSQHSLAYSLINILATRKIENALNNKILSILETQPQTLNINIVKKYKDLILKQNEINKLLEDRVNYLKKNYVSNSLTKTLTPDELNLDVENNIKILKDLKNHRQTHQITRNLFINDFEINKLFKENQLNESNINKERVLLKQHIFDKYKDLNKSDGFPTENIEIVLNLKILLSINEVLKSHLYYIMTNTYPNTKIIHKSLEEKINNFQQSEEVVINNKKVLLSNKYDKELSI